MIYENRIVLSKPQIKKSKFIVQPIKIHGKNCGAIYDENNKVYNVKDKIIIEFDNIKYKLVEYHFHLPDKKFQAEIHYVFMETGCYYNKTFNVCNDEVPQINGGILVIVKMIHDNIRSSDFSKIQVKSPKNYYEYDGIVTTGDFSTVKWIIDEDCLHLKLKDIIFIAKK